MPPDRDNYGVVSSELGSLGQPSTVRVARILRRTAIPVGVFLLHRTMLGLVAWLEGYQPFAATTWARWDSAYYLHIAANGYLPIEACSPETHYPATAWCGNAGWFPGYSWVIAVVGAPGVSLDVAGVLVAALAQLGCLLVLWRYLDDDDAWPALGVAAFFLGNVYSAAIFPVSLFLLSALVCLGACWSGRYRLAAVAGAAAATCYPTGILLAPVVIAWSVLHRRWRALLIVVGVVAGYALVLFVLRTQAGQWDAFFRIQERYDYKPGLGIDAFLARFKPLVNPRYRDAKGVVTAIQEVVATGLFGALAIHWRRLIASPRNRLVLFYFAAFFGAPLMLGGRLAWYRSEALLFPIALVVPVLPRRLQLVFLGALVLVTLPMSALFFRGWLV